jgi:protein-tyrosine phosphatase
MTDKPIPESYWVIPGSFLAGAYPVNSRNPVFVRSCLAAFLEAGFDTFFDLTRAGERPAYLPDLQVEAARHGIPIQYQRVDMQDWGLPAQEQMVVLLDGIDAALAAGRKVYLHCWGGIGRTGMTVGCWLVRQGLTGGQALIRLNELYRTAGQSRLYPQSPETDAQVKFILDWLENGVA